MQQNSTRLSDDIRCVNFNLSLHFPNLESSVPLNKNYYEAEHQSSMVHRTSSMNIKMNQFHGKDFS
jgi:hypothetical protein